MVKKSSPNKPLSIVVALVLLALVGFVMIQSGGTGTTTWTTPWSNVEIRDGIQYITVEARGGYSPRITTAKWGIPTKLIMKTNNTYDCSSALVVRAANYRGMLPQTGKTEIDLGTPKSGTKIPWTCGMGMYNFSLTFQ